MVHLTYMKTYPTVSVIFIQYMSTLRIACSLNIICQWLIGKVIKFLKFKSAVSCSDFILEYNELLYWFDTTVQYTSTVYVQYRIYKVHVQYNSKYTRTYVIHVQ